MDDTKLNRWQYITMATLFTGYAGYYICRSNFSVATPLILTEFKDAGIDKAAIGGVASTGVMLYALGKITNGLLADFVGGRLLFIGGMVASVMCTVAFGMSAGLAAFTVIWAINRYVQSGGWVSLVKVSSRWFPLRRYATIMGVLSMSYLLGDAFARGYLGLFLELGVGWRGLFFIAAGTVGAIALVSLFTLKGSPQEVGLKEPNASAANVYGVAGNAPVPPSFGKLIGPLLASPVFWLCGTLNFGLTLIRETFNFWSPTFLTEVTGASNSQAAIGSMVFPLVGAVSAFSAGALSDRFDGRHGRVIFPSIVLLTVALCVLAFANMENKYYVALVLLSSVSFFLIAPYSFLSGVIAMDLGGKQGSSTTAGLLDSAGYLGAIVSGWGIGKIAEEYGWSAAFGFLAGVCGITAIVAAVYWIHQERTHGIRGVLASIVEVDEKTDPPASLEE